MIEPQCRTFRTRARRGASKNLIKTVAMPASRTKRQPAASPEASEGPPSKRLRGPAAATPARPVGGCPVPVLAVRQYISIVDSLLKMEAAELFLEPVDYVTLGLKDYPKIVKHPMDLGTIKRKLGFGSYQRGEDVLKDVRRLRQLHACRMHTSCTPHAHLMCITCAPHAHTARTLHAPGATRLRQLLPVQRPRQPSYPHVRDGATLPLPHRNSAELPRHRP